VEQLSFVDDGRRPRRDYARDAEGRFLSTASARGPVPSSAEVATIGKAEFLAPLSMLEYPNLSAIIRGRSEGQGIRFYDTMEGTDSDLAGFFRDLVDDVLHYPYTIRAASDDPAHKEHAAFFNYVIESIPNWQNVVRHFLTAYARGFAVTEKMFRVVDRGDWKGAVVYDNLMDKPQRWFTFDTDRRLRLRTYQNYIPGELVDQGKFIVTVFGSTSNPFGEALFDLCYWAWYLKHHALKNQALFMEKWAAPTAKAEYEWSSNDKLNQENRQKALSVLQSIQSDQSIAVPKGMIVSLLESMRNGTVSFESYIDQLTEMESRIVTGQLLTSMGASGGSHALGKVHEKRAANKVEMLADFVSEEIGRKIGRDLIDRNYGPQDAYPTFQILAQSPLSRQADAELEKTLLANGHKISRSFSDKAFQIVTPTDAGDELTIPVGEQPSQDLPVNPNLAAPQKVALASAPEHRGLHAGARAAAAETLRHLDAVGRKASAAARPAIRKAVKGLAKTVRKTDPKKLKKATVYRGLKGIDVHDLGNVMEQMVSPTGAPQVSMAVDVPSDAPPAISEAALLALALQMIGIAERVADAAVDAPEGMDGPAYADSLTDPNGAAIDDAFANMFEGTHSTNISSIATAQLRANLSDPAYRKKFPYVMIVTKPDARLPHLMMDGFILSAEEAQYSPFLPPFGFGCRCQAVPISAETAKSTGLTGAAPAGPLDDFLRGKGATPSPSGGYTGPDGQKFTPGGQPGFQPAYASTDYNVQLEALRAKAEALRAEDPEAWAALKTWLDWLFGRDILAT
jgi:phage gp29-like protein